MIRTFVTDTSVSQLFCSVIWGIFIARIIGYAVHTVFEAVEYGLGVNNVTLHSRKCVASDRRDLEHFIHNLVRPFDSYRRLAMVIVALIYIERARSHLKQHDIHRTIFLSAMMLATKVSLPF